MISPARAVEIRVTGLVQGVGFRPHVHRLALRHGIDGWVRNEPGAVRIVAQHSGHGGIDPFLTALQNDLPPLARIDAIDVVESAPGPLQGFRVMESDVAQVGRLPVSPDVALCPACTAEMHDPSNRRFRYPFITCTDCGPRFTVIEAMPYDRERTTMRAFAQCAECQREYEDPADRRYHSETNSCPVCGPSVWLEAAGEEPLNGSRAIARSAILLARGRILAIRGLGGFHLAVDARSDEAVRRLRDRKQRESRPFALMVRDLAGVESLAHISDAAAALLASRERPIVVLPGKRESPVASSVAPGLDTVGIMLAYTPLHVLLLEAFGGPLVMTSGNLSEEPIATGNEEARCRLGSIADAFLLHDRDIIARYDDSLVRVVDEAPVLLRRSRGYAPLPLRLPVAASKALLAVGPHLKNTFTLGHGPDAFVSQHIGDLENLETLDHFHDSLSRFERLFGIRPERVVRDLHPGYLSTRVAEDSGLEQLPPVQHHHAHIAAVLGEHGVIDRALGLAFDGTGYGADGHVWGFEFLEADIRDYERLAHLRYAPLPGGDLAVRSPWRTLLGYASLDDASTTWCRDALAEVPDAEMAIARRQIERNLNSPVASSMGRLFDAAAAALGIRFEAAWEGQAAMELESLAACGRFEPLPFPLMRVDGDLPVFDPLPLLETLARQRMRGVDIAVLAARFHDTLSSAVSDFALELCDRRRLDRVVLAGGCFQNARLLSSVRRRLEGGGVDVLTPVTLGPNDGAVSYGQAVVAAARMNA